MRIVEANKSYINQLYRLSRPLNTIQPIIIILFGYVLVGGNLLTKTYDFKLLFTICILFIIHSTITILNDIQDRDIDIDNGVSTLITRSNNDKNRLRRYVLGLVLITSWLASFFISVATFWLIGCIMLGSIFYNFAPVYGSRRPIISIGLLSILYGALPFLIGATINQNQSLSISHIPLLALGWGLLQGSLSILKDFKDISGDKKNGKITFLIRFGKLSTITTSHLLSIAGILFILTTTAQYMHQAWWSTIIISILSILYLLRRLALIHRALSIQALTKNTDKLFVTQARYNCILLLWLIIF